MMEKLNDILKKICFVVFFAVLVCPHAALIVIVKVAYGAGIVNGIMACVAVALLFFIASATVSLFIVVWNRCELIDKAERMRQREVIERYGPPDLYRCRHFYGPVEWKRENDGIQ